MSAIILLIVATIITIIVTISLMHYGIIVTTAIMTKTIINHHVSSLQWQLLAAVTLDIVGTVAFCKVPFI